MTSNTMHCLCEGLVSDVCYFAPKWDSSLTVWIRAWLGGSAASTSPHTWVFGESGGTQTSRATTLFYSTSCSLVGNIIHRF